MSILMNKFVVLLVLGVLPVNVSAAVNACADLQALLQKELEQQHLDAAATRIGQMESSCPSAQLQYAKRYYTDVLAKQANQLVNQDKLSDATVLIAKAKAVSWIINSVLGDIAAKKANWKEAALQYHLAYDLITDPAHVEQTPALLKQQTKIYQLASEAQMLYGELDATLTRGGTSLLLPTRGITIEPYIPIEFDTNQFNLTPIGQNSANQLVDYIKNHPELTQVVLYGYTDPRGSPARNLQLSQQRAQTVADYLRHKGISIPITAIGKGYSQPLLSNDNYTEEQRWKIARRVQLQLD